jgi:hypothetical protein
MRPTFRRHMLPPSRRFKKTSSKLTPKCPGCALIVKGYHLYTSRWSDWTHSSQSASQSNPILTGITSASTQTHFLRHRKRGGMLLWNFSINQQQYKVQTPRTLQCARFHPTPHPHEGSHLTLVISLHDFPRQNIRPRYIHTHTHTHIYETSG